MLFSSTASNASSAPPGKTESGENIFVEEEEEEAGERENVAGTQGRLFVLPPTGLATPFVS